MRDKNNSTNKLRALLDAAIDGIITIDDQGNIETFNPAAEKLFFYKSKEVIGRNIKMLIPHKWAAKHDGYIERYLKTGKKRIIGIGRDLEALRKDGTVFPIHLSVGEYAVGGIRYFVGIIHDQSARKKTENALFNSQKMEAIGQLTGGIAHDFNNLLTVITGNLELLEMQLDSDTQLDFLKEAEEAANLGAELTHRLLTFARRGVLEPVELDLNKLIKNLVQLLKRTLGANINLRTSLAKDLWVALADQGQVGSALINLAINARDAMPDGGNLVIETRNETIDSCYAEQEIGLLPGEYIRISIIDSGEGMSQKTLQKVFEPFFTTKPAGKGTGLGLSMVYGFAKQSGGHITIYSEENIGTTVSLYLPRQANDMAVKTQNRELSDSAPSVGGKETILVVEDDPRVRKLTIKRLKALGYELLSAEDGKKAKSLLKKRADIQLVFTDLVMPGGVSGYQLPEFVSRQYPSIKLLLTSGFAEELISNTELEKSRFQLLRKPYSQSSLAAAIRNALES